MRIYATFKGVSHLENKSDKNFKGKLILNWEKLNDEMAKEVEGTFSSNKTQVFNNITLKIGNRYVFDCKDIKDREINQIKTIKTVFKNKRCSIIRKVGDTYHFVKGKYKDKVHSEIESNELTAYLIWLARNTDNESTVKKTLEILELIKNKNGE